MPNDLTTILDRFQSRLTYQELDRKALDISRSIAAGNLGADDSYAEWAMLSNDPIVMVNYVKTFITTIAAKLAANPVRPEQDDLAEIGLALRLNALFADSYADTLADGYAYLGIGMVNDTPQVRQIDARYIMFNGDDLTLKDSTEIIVFEIVPRETDAIRSSVFPTGYVDFDSQNERVITSYYHIHEKTGEFILDIYEDYDSKPKNYVLAGLNRIPIVRFAIDKIELGDKRFHYRGLYYQTASVLKAMTVAATKIQIRTSTSDDDNYIVPKDGIENHMAVWQNSGVKTYDRKDANGEAVESPIPIQHDNQFLINAYQNWKSTISDILGPVVASSSEAVTREEVIARNEVRDAIANTYMMKMCDSIAEVYRCIQMFMHGTTTKVTIVGGFIDSVKRTKYNTELTAIYTYAKESGLNTQGFVSEFLEASDLPMDTKQRIGATLKQDPFASPKVQQLTVQIKQLQAQLQEKDQQITMLRIQATQRLERQAEFVAMQERVKRGELAFKQWSEEQKDTQEGRMALLDAALKAGDVQGALQILHSIESRDSLVTSQPAVAENMSQSDPIYDNSVAANLATTQQGV